MQCTCARTASGLAARAIAKPTQQFFSTVSKSSRSFHPERAAASRNAGRHPRGLQTNAPLRNCWNGSRKIQTRNYANAVITNRPSMPTEPVDADVTLLNSQKHPHPVSPVAGKALSTEQLAGLLGRLRLLLEEYTGMAASSSTSEAGLESRVRHIGLTTLNESQGDEAVWLNRLTAAMEEVESAGIGQHRRTRVLLVGDSHRVTSDFTLALLDDPLSSDQQTRNILQARQETSSSHTVETHVITGSTRAVDIDGQVSSQTFTDSAWLQQNNVDVVELVHRDPSRAFTPAEWNTILASDAVMMLSPDYETAFNETDRARLLRQPNVIRVLAPDDSRSNISSQLFAPVSQHQTLSAVPIMRAGTSLALQANEILRSSTPYSGGKSACKGDFASMLLRSGIPQLREWLETSICSATHKNHTLPPSHYQRILSLARSIMLVMTDAMVEARGMISQASDELSVLELRSARDKRHSQLELGFTDLGKVDMDMLVNDAPVDIHRAVSPDAATSIAADSANAGVVAVVDANKASAAEEAIVPLLDDGRKSVEKALNGKRLRWWKLPFGRADDIAVDLSNGLSGYFVDLERKLVFETGRLSERSLALSALVDSLFKAPSAFGPRSRSQPTLYSASIQNQLQQVSPSSAFSFPPPSHPSPLNLRHTSFSAPIADRRMQLASPGGPIEKLQLRAQRAVLQFYSIAGTSSATAIFLGLTPIESLALSLPSSIGLALLGNVLAGWLLQGKWIKAKKQFWKDWLRAQDGLSYDLQSNGDFVLDTKVFIKADQAKRSLRAHLKSRSAKLDRLREELQMCMQILPTS